MPDPFLGKNVIVTGASSGIGRSLAMKLANQGAKVGLIARRGDLLEQLASELSAKTIRWASADVSQRDQIQRAFAELRQSLGPIDLLIANAGVGTPTLLDPVNIRDVERMIHVNLLGTIYTVEAALPEMIRRKSGWIAAVSSLAAFKGLPGESGYCASKAAINTYMEGLRIQLRAHHVGATVVCPGFVETPMTAVNDFPMPFVMNADRAAEHILWAIAKRRKIYRFPRRMSWLTRLLGILPDWAVAKSMASYNEKPPMNQLEEPGS